ncbi:MAG: DUF3268 family zinc-finger domain-containing protein [Defluviitaleaceae bacterium]|nr:DUF3268 family zinc-finger domain-containing protein [Defluviitaleaceae bacterium]
MKKDRQKDKSAKHKKHLLCPYCGAQALLREGSFIFEDVYVKHLYVCARYPVCDSYVAAHDNSKKPMGSLANSTLRKKRILAHFEFDRLWKGDTPIFNRKQAYKWLSDKLGGHIHRLHIGNMGEGMCDLTIREARRVMWVHKQNKLVEGGA